MAESVRLLSGNTVTNCIEGSNPSLSANGNAFAKRGHFYIGWKWISVRGFNPHILEYGHDEIRHIDFKKSLT